MHVFSTVTCVQLNDNQLTSVDGLEKLVNLSDLYVSVLDTLGPCLHVFSTVTCVQLSGTQLTSVKGLEKLVNLTYLDVSVLACVTLQWLLCMYSQL